MSGPTKQTSKLAAVPESQRKIKNNPDLRFGGRSIEEVTGQLDE